jgi:hypothetical protein
MKREESPNEESPNEEHAFRKSKIVLKSQFL